MSYFDDASLVMIPSGYKTSKVYSVKPTDGSGDLTFSRSNDTATRVNSAGLIEKVRTNLITYSQDFSNAAWVKAGTTSITATGVTDPNGGTTAVTVSFPALADELYQLAGLLTGEFTNSFYVKGTAGETIAIWKLGATYELKTLTGAWQRISATSNLSSNTGYAAIGRAGSAATATSVSIAFAQAEMGVATDYIATTSAAVSVGPVANVPRLDYLNSSCPRLLLEPQRTNLVTYSEQLNNANWGSFQSASVTANTTISPDGYQNADTITFSSDPSSLIFQNYTSTSSTFTISVYAKSSTGKKFCFRNFDGVGVVRSSDFTTTSSWQRFSFTFTSALANVAICNEVGGNVGSIQVYGAQLEAGAYATSYIPTLGAAVTRGADAATKTGISSLIGQTEGTLYAEFDVTLGVNGGEYFLSDGTNVIAIQFPPSSPNTIRAIIYNGGGFPVLMDYTYSTAGSHKVAYAYKANDFVLYVDGVQRASDTSGTVPACSIVQFGGAQNVASALVFKTRLSNADLAALTA